MSKRPVYLNLFRLHLPLLGWVSILHRVTGILLFLGLPAALALLQSSLSGPSGFDEAAAMLRPPFARFLSLMVIASLAHHALAGLRHLAMDMHLGVQKNMARASASAVMIAAGLVAALAAWSLFG